MTHVVSRLIKITSLVAVFGIALSLTAEQAEAQVRAALTKNVDEPGRLPYQQMIEFYDVSATCPTLGFCIIPFNAVPAGKRLVVEFLTVMVASGSSPNLLTFGDGLSPISGNVAILEPAFTHGASFIGFPLWNFSKPVTVYYEAGQVPKVKISGPQLFAFANMSIHGYLIDAAN